MENASSLHALLLLSDSALPLGSFAFSSGLESYLAHQKQSNKQPPTASSTTTPLQAFDAFLDMSLRNLASTSLPYVLDAYHDPRHLAELDNDLDASTPCTVARRASVSQGKALINLWERALAPEIQSSSSSLSSGSGSGSGSDSDSRFLSQTKCREESIRQMAQFVAVFKRNRKDANGLAELNAHFAPLFGSVCRALGLGADDTAYLFLLNHSKAVLSAAVRASVMGPYQSHAILASGKLQARIRGYVDGEKDTRVRDAGLTVPAMDIWIGRHELLYSRIFNS